MYKGYNHDSFADINKTREAAATGANLLRWHIVFGTQGLPFDDPNPAVASYMGYLRGYIWHARNHTIPGVSGTNTKILINVLDSPGGVDSRRRIVALKDEGWRFRLIEVFRILATEFRDDPEILGYSLNEPGGNDKALRNLMIHLWATITDIHPGKIFSVTNSFSQPGNFNEIVHINSPNAWHEVHCYEPMSFTHQGVHGRRIGKRYPSSVFGRRSLERRLRHVRRFQDKHPRANIFMGEFSASIYASPEARLRYISDCLDIADSRGWHWCYHSYGLNQPWTPTPEMQVRLAQSFAR